VVAPGPDVLAAVLPPGSSELEAMAEHMLGSSKQHSAAVAAVEQLLLLLPQLLGATAHFMGDLPLLRYLSLVRLKLQCIRVIASTYVVHLGIFWTDIAKALSAHLLSLCHHVHMSSTVLVPDSLLRRQAPCKEAGL
jgi:hypothetical protein